MIPNINSSVSDSCPLVTMLCGCVFWWYHVWFDCDRWVCTKTTLVRISPTVHSRQLMMTTLTALHSACKLVQRPIMRRGLYSALLLGGSSRMSDSHRL